MFHVEPNFKCLVNKGKWAILMLYFILYGCIGARPTTQISDYILVPNGKEIVGQKNLTAFIFENNTKNLPIEKFLSQKIQTDNYSENEFWVTIDKNKYKIIVYDYSEFEKYFNSANYSVINLEPETTTTRDQRKFIAISMINNFNEDCLAENSLFQSIAVNYLKKLKDEYYNQ